MDWGLGEGKGTEMSLWKLILLRVSDSHQFWAGDVAQFVGFLLGFDPLEWHKPDLMGHTCNSSP